MDDEAKWQAVQNNDRNCDGKFFYAIASTGIFCRPSCASRVPLRKNVRFFDTAQEAEQSGFRPCKRCRPDLLGYQPVEDMAVEMKKRIDTCFAEREILSEELRKLGLSQHRMVEIFKKQYHQTPNEYADELRIHFAKKQLSEGTESIVGIGLALGFESVSSFYGFFRKYTQMTPGEYRRLFVETKPSGSCYYTYDMPVGALDIVSNGSGITGVRMSGLGREAERKAADPLTDRAARQLEEYFNRKRRKFELPLLPGGTVFQRAVWDELVNIPYGQTRSYKQIAEAIGNPGAGRAVGMANNKNPLLIVVPCHRVIGADGSLVGYAAGLEVKKRLLELEAENRGSSGND